MCSFDLKTKSTNKLNLEGALRQNLACDKNSAAVKQLELMAFRAMALPNSSNTCRYLVSGNVSHGTKQPMYEFLAQNVKGQSQG